MQCVAREIVVTDLLLISAIANPRTQPEDVSFQKPTAAAAATSIYATALFGSQCEGAYVSVNFVEKALGSQVSRERSGILFTARVTWHLAILSQSTETSYLRVVYELDHDFVFGRRTACNSWKNSPVSPQPLYSNSSSSSSNRGGFQEGSRRMDVLTEYLANLDESNLNKQLADTAFIKSSASGLGIGLEGELAFKAFAGLLRQRVQVIRHDRHAPGSSNPLLLARGTTSETTSRSEDVESLVSSGFDEGDLVYEGSTTSSEMTWERNFHRLPPSSSLGTEQVCTRGVDNTLMQAAQVTRESSPSSWQMVENTSQAGSTEDFDIPEQTYRAETKELVELSHGQGQRSDFEAHPGHRVWEWDKEKQRWRRRGRDGLVETDWFPKSLA
ncbi:hypothetical protein CDV31_011339 [Fusarium ambrosium]|uniref:Uncharacterized protein n=1 Tax=Fusarium ambrosium TaxID=131363 RepID=A0A428TH73_9HYPO|nr:hypothetical protein CDV31_011339 [Fusarium ambrosium]